MVSFHFKMKASNAGFGVLPKTFLSAELESLEWEDLWIKLLGIQLGAEIFEGFGKQENSISTLFSIFICIPHVTAIFFVVALASLM